MMSELREGGMRMKPFTKAEPAAGATMRGGAADSCDRQNTGTTTRWVVPVLAPAVVLIVAALMSTSILAGCSSSAPEELAAANDRDAASHAELVMDETAEKPDTTSEQASDQPNLSAVEEIIAEAEAAARAGEFERALQLCQRALEQQPDHDQARMVCLISACNLGEASQAKGFFAQMSGDQREPAQQICKRFRIELD
jgi:outer membrane murein-binding lipoprotein Lpp